MSFSTSPVRTSSLPIQRFAEAPKPKPKSSSLWGFLRILEGIAIGVASIVAPETLPALIAIAAVDIGSNLAIDLVEKSEGIKTDIWGNLVVNTFANAIPFVSTLRNIAREAEFIKNTSKALEQFKDIEILQSGRSEALASIKSKGLDLDVYKSLTRKEQLEYLKEAKTIRNDLVSGLLEQAARTNDVNRLTKIAKPLELLGVVDREAVQASGKLELGRNFLMKNDSLFEDIHQAAKEDVLKDLEQFGDAQLENEELGWLNKRGQMITSKTIMDPEAAVGKFSILSQVRRDIRNFPKRAWDWLSWKETRNFVSMRSEMKDLNGYQKFVKYFAGEAGYKATQRVQMFNANDLAREFINRPMGYLRHLVVQKSVGYRKILEKKFGALRLDKLTKAWENNIIPFPSSEWLAGCRIIKGDPTGIINHLIVYHKNQKYRPVFIKGVPKSVILDFLGSTSKGAAYHKLFSWSKNGRDIIRLGWKSAALFSALPLNALRNMLSTLSNFKGVIKTGMEEKGNFAKAYVDKFAETIERNAPNKLARTFASFMFGGSGFMAQQSGKYASALMNSFGVGKGFARLGQGKSFHPLGSRTFNSAPLITAGLTTIRTQTIRVSQRRGIQSAAQRRVAQRYLGRVKGLQTISGLRHPRNK